MMMKSGSCPCNITGDAGLEGRMQKDREGKWNGGFAPYRYGAEILRGQHDCH